MSLLATGQHAVRNRSWALAVALAALCGLALVLLFLLAQATNNRALYEENYGRLLALNVVVAGVLLLVIVWFCARLFIRWRRGKFGSRLLVKLAAIFALVGLVPGLLIYTVSYQFVSRSIESWFDVKVEGALAAGLTLGTATLDALSNELTTKARLGASQLSEATDTGAALMLERVREQLGVSDAVLWSGNGAVVASSGRSRFELLPARPSIQQFRIARERKVQVQIEGLDDAPSLSGASQEVRIKALAVLPGSNIALLAEPRYLLVTQVLPSSLVANALSVQEANREYQERALSRHGLRRMYIGTLTLTLFLAVFGAVLLAAVLGNQLVKPLLVLAEGVQQVAAGNLTPKAVLQSHDELAGLTRSFAQMTQQLLDARVAVESGMEKLSQARENLQIIMDNLTAGVMVLDRQGRVLSGNPSAQRVLKVPPESTLQQAFASASGLAAFAQGVLQQFGEIERTAPDAGSANWQQSFELHAQGQGIDATAVTVLARGALLPDGNWLLVFDDISDVISAQRMQAWGEVARRLAHEIKNPLTPIQLSAERLERKLADRLEDADQRMLGKSVKTIIEQVDAMKRLVNEFRDYARLPAADLKPLSLNSLVADVLQLYGHDTIGQWRGVRVALDAACPDILADAQQLRQVIHNLIQNAQDANEAALATSRPASRPQNTPEPPIVTICTAWQPSTQSVKLTVEDQGGGFSEHILKRAFEPYVTTKAKGTGLGLAVVKKIADEHRAKVELRNLTTSAEPPVRSAQVSITFPAATGHTMAP